MIIEKKKKLMDKEFTELGLPDDGEVYVNINLSPAFRSLDYFCRKLKKDTVIFTSFTSSTMVKIKLNEKGLYEKITHINDLRSLFLDILF